MILSLQNLDWHGFLARPPLPPPSPEALDALRRESILITGAGGSIGSALALRLGTIVPPKLILLDASESNLYALQRDWSNTFAAKPITSILGNVADRELLDVIFATHTPRIVFHAAAFKQVPLMEEQPFAAIQNNIFATESLTQAAAAHGARVILLSTDKAVAPASVMGATKRIAEQIVLTSGGTVLRLVNVLASRDSVAEIFSHQITQGGPVTVTDPAARRYFITHEEAVDLLIAAALQESQTLLAPELSTTHNIQDFARFMARMLAPQREITIIITENRPGDKEIEELCSAGDRTRATSCDRLVAVETTLPTRYQLEAELARMRAAVDARDLGDALAHLRAMVPDYTPSQAVLALAKQSRPRVCA